MNEADQLDTVEGVAHLTTELCNWYAASDDEGELTEEEIRDDAAAEMYEELGAMEVDAEDARYLAVDEAAENWRL